MRRGFCAKLCKVNLIATVSPANFIEDDLQLHRSRAPHGQNLPAGVCRCDSPSYLLPSGTVLRREATASPLCRSNPDWELLKLSSSVTINGITTTSRALPLLASNFATHRGVHVDGFSAQQPT